MCPSGRQYIFFARTQNTGPKIIMPSALIKITAVVRVSDYVLNTFCHIFNPPGRGLFRGVLSLVALLYSFSPITLLLWSLRESSSRLLRKIYTGSMQIFFNGRSDMHSPEKYALLAPTVQDDHIRR